MSLLLRGILFASLIAGDAAAQAPRTLKPKPVPIRKTAPAQVWKATPTPPKRVTKKPVSQPVARKTAPPPPAKPAVRIMPPAAPVVNEAYVRLNSLGMKFVRFGEIEVCVWPVRVSDFAAFARDTGVSVPKPVFVQGPDHPVVNVTWREAVKFCDWLTAAERSAGLLPNDREYRLPDDREWSSFAGLGAETGDTPEARDLGVLNVYPWGAEWPPPRGAGNFSDEDFASTGVAADNLDGFRHTSPVGRFDPNGAGLHDLAGNVAEWCRDAWNEKTRDRVLRGSSWFNGALPMSLMSSARVRAGTERASDSIGFRVVISPVRR